MRLVIPLVAAALLWGGCSQRRAAEPAPAQAPPPAPVTEAAVTSTPAPAPAPGIAISGARTLDAYKVEIAQRIHAASGDISSGRPQDLLRAVIVLNITLDTKGQPVRIAIQRTPGDPEAEQRAIASVRRAAPYPRPSGAVARGAAAFEFSETWLFNTDGRYQLRSLAQTQAGG